jgi:uncharacterized protein (TIGR00725 family)
MNKKLQIGVIGSAGREEYLKGNGGSTDEMLLKAKEVGSLLAKKGAIVVTGGKSGIMEAAAKGAKENNGLAIGVIKGSKRFTSNAYTDIEVLTGMAADGFDELMLVLMCDALIVIGGGAGTLEELAIAYRNNKPIVGLKNSGGWSDKVIGTFLDERETVLVETAEQPEEAVEKAIELAKAKNELS